MKLLTLLVHAISIDSIFSVPVPDKVQSSTGSIAGNAASNTALQANTLNLKNTAASGSEASLQAINAQIVNNAAFGLGTQMNSILVDNSGQPLMNTFNSLSASSSTTTLNIPTQTHASTTTTSSTHGATTITTFIPKVTSSLATTVTMAPNALTVSVVIPSATTNSAPSTPTSSLTISAMGSPLLTATTNFPSIPSTPTTASNAPNVSGLFTVNSHVFNTPFTSQSSATPSAVPIITSVQQVVAMGSAAFANLNSNVNLNGTQGNTIAVTGSGSSVSVGVSGNGNSGTSQQNSIGVTGQNSQAQVGVGANMNSGNTQVNSVGVTGNRSLAGASVQSNVNGGNAQVNSVTLSGSATQSYSSNVVGANITQTNGQQTQPYKELLTALPLFSSNGTSGPQSSGLVSSGNSVTVASNVNNGASQQNTASDQKIQSINGTVIGAMVDSHDQTLNNMNTTVFSTASTTNTAYDNSSHELSNVSNTQVYNIVYQTITGTDGLTTQVAIKVPVDTPVLAHNSSLNVNTQISGALVSLLGNGDSNKGAVSLKLQALVAAIVDLTMDD